jgi:hypothetical protein
MDASPATCLCFFGGCFAISVAPRRRLRFPNGNGTNTHCGPFRPGKLLRRKLRSPAGAAPGAGAWYARASPSGEATPERVIVPP